MTEDRIKDDKTLQVASTKDVKAWMQSSQFHDAVKQALPSHLTAERFIRVALTAIMRTPDLANCSQNSLFKCMLDLSSLGLEPDGRRAHLIPYRNSRNNTTEAQLIIDYKGLIELAKRSGEVKNWRAELICERDEFTWQNGTVEHKVDWLNPRGKVLGVYSHVRNKNDVDDYEVMTLDEVQAIKKRSKAGNVGPWVSDFNEMAKKTVMRRHSKRLTLSPEFSDALAKDADQIDLEGEIVADPVMPKRASAQPEPAAPINTNTHAEGVHHEGGNATVTTPMRDERLISEAQCKRFYAIYKKAGFTDDQAKDYLITNYNIEDPNLITKANYDAICAYFENGQWMDDEAGARG